jgi:hypothetical protein
MPTYVEGIGEVENDRAAQVNIGHFDRARRYGRASGSAKSREMTTACDVQRHMLTLNVGGKCPWTTVARATR